MLKQGFLCSAFSESEKGLCWFKGKYTYYQNLSNIGVCVCFSLWPWSIGINSLRITFVCRVSSGNQRGNGKLVMYGWFPITASIYSRGFPIAMFDSQRVSKMIFDDDLDKSLALNAGVASRTCTTGALKLRTANLWWNIPRCHLQSALGQIWPSSLDAN
jgi:hypothetical protein